MLWTKPIFLLSFISYCNAAGKFCSRYKCEKRQGNVVIGHFSGHVILDYFLNDTSQKEYSSANETYCVKKCVKRDKCRTISIVPDAISTNATCYLSKSNIYETKPIFKKGSKIIFLGTAACGSSPCKDGSKCQPHFETGGYTCSDIRPEMYFSFDKDFEAEYKVGSKKLTPKDIVGKVVKVYDAKSPVLMAMGNGRGADYSHSAQFLGNPLTSDLTIGLWLKYSGVNDVTVHPINGENVWPVTFHKGEYQLRMIYSGGSKYMRYKMPSIHSYNTWHHLVLRVTKEKMILTINGVTRSQEDIKGLSAISSAFGDFNVQGRFMGANIVRFADILYIYNDFKSDEFVKEWYTREKRNYAISNDKNEIP